MRKYVRQKIEANMADPAYAHALSLYLLFGQVLPKYEFDFGSLEEYEDYLRTNPPQTLRGEAVKSYGEKDIANWLTQHGIRYEYEAEYPVDTRTEQYGQYHPDFFLPDHNIYIEYYGVNRNMEVPAFFSSKDGKSATEIYRESMAWKEQLHKENGTKLIVCYAYEQMEGNLLELLEQKLRREEVPIREVSLDELFEQMGAAKKSVLEGLAELIQTILNLARSRRYSMEDLKSLCASPRYISQQVLLQLVAPIFSDYETMLQQEDAIDFEDMINRAEDMVNGGRYHHHYKYVIVDEYQDISSAQYRLLQAMRKDKDYTLFAVGDDWQSIYRFAGSDISYILNFEKYWGPSEISKIETTYRFPQRLIDITGNFIMQNPNQLKKAMRSNHETRQGVIGEIHGYTDRNAVSFMVDRIRELPANSTVYFIGRYQFDSDMLKNSPDLLLSYNNIDQRVEVRMSSRRDLKMAFYTAHKSKGLQADYVFIINNRSGRMGFPSKVQNPPLVELMLEQADGYPDAEERRLFYVAMTRAKKKVYLVTAGNRLSSFATELKSRYQAEIQADTFSCPLCGAPLRKISGQYGDFLGCSNFRVTGCRYKRQLGSKKNHSF